MWLSSSCFCLSSSCDGAEAELESDAERLTSVPGSQGYGCISPGTNREFSCLDKSIKATFENCLQINSLRAYPSIKLHWKRNLTLETFPSSNTWCQVWDTDTALRTPRNRGSWFSFPLQILLTVVYSPIGVQHDNCIMEK